MSTLLDLDRLMQVAQMLGATGGTQMAPGLRSKEASLTLSTMPTLYGTSGMFSICGSNDLLSLTLEDEPFLSWLGWKPNNEVRQFVKMLTYVGPAAAVNGTPTTGAKAACDDASTVSYGTCEVLLCDKGRIKRAGPVRDLTENNRRICDAQPLYMKDGSLIQNELAWSSTMAGIAIRQDLKRYIITGNPSTEGEFAGLESLVNTGYKDVNTGARCSAMDSIVLDWGSNILTYKPNGVHQFIDYLIDIVRRIRQRATWSNLGGIALTDQVIVLPTFLRNCLLDVFTCWSVCPGAAYNETNLNTYEARNYRNTLNGGAFGQGQIFIDSMPIPVITYDWLDYGQSAPYFTSDIYVLTRQIGNIPVLWGQYIDMAQPAQAFNTAAGYTHYQATDGGRFLVYWKTDNECTQTTVVTRPNLYMSAPWAQARIQNVACMRPLAPISPDPNSSYYAEEYITEAVAPDSYLVDNCER
jgi:hypothetical protein